MPTSAQIHVDKPLTNISVAYMQEASNFVAGEVFPMVKVQKESDRYFVYSRADWYRDEAKIRANATESAGGDYNIDNTPTYFCEVVAYHKDVTERDRVNSDTPLDADTDATEFVSAKLLLKREVDWAAKFFVTGAWTNEFAGAAATAIGSQEFEYWDKSTSDPIANVAYMATYIQSKTGYRPNTMVVAQAVYDALVNHPDVLDRIKYTQRGIATAELLAALFGVDRVLVASAVKNSAAEGATESTDFIMGNHVLLAYRPKRAGLKTPSAGYTFTWTGYLGASAWGSRMIRLPMDNLGLGTERIEGEMAYDIKQVADDLGFFVLDIIQ